MPWKSIRESVPDLRATVPEHGDPGLDDGREARTFPLVLLLLLLGVIAIVALVVIWVGFT
jgi:hypothetical protein